MRNGSVIDLRIAAGEVSAQVMGSDLYQITVNIAAVPKAQWHALGGDCAGSIDSLVELLQGRLSKGVMERICRPQTGLFPSPKEIKLNCSCPDWAEMCKHVVAVLYGVGARLDEQPQLLFTLRKVDAKDLVARAGAGLPLAKKAPAAGKMLDQSKLAEVFGIEMADAVVPDLRAKATLAKKIPLKRKAPVRKKKAVTRKAATGATSVSARCSALLGGHRRRPRYAMMEAMRVEPVESDAAAAGRDSGVSDPVHRQPLWSLRGKAGACDSYPFPCASAPCDRLDRSDSVGYRLQTVAATR